MWPSFLGHKGPLHLPLNQNNFFGMCSAYKTKNEMDLYNCPLYSWYCNCSFQIQVLEDFFQIYFQFNDEQGLNLVPLFAQPLQITAVSLPSQKTSKICLPSSALPSKSVFHSNGAMVLKSSPSSQTAYSSLYTSGKINWNLEKNFCWQGLLS